MRAWNRAAFLFFLGSALFLFWRSPGGVTDPRPTDAFMYAYSAIHFVEHGRYAVEVLGGVHPPRYPPGFPLFFLAPVYLAGWARPGLGLLPVLASTLGVLALTAGMARKILGPSAGMTAAFALLFCLLQVYFFRFCARTVMSDIPALLLSFLCLCLYRRARAEGRTRDFLLAGLCAALAFQVRWTCLSLALPFALLLFRRGMRTPARFLALGVPLAASLGATLLYDYRVFGHPFFTGYQYWISDPRNYTLSLSHACANLDAFLHPFHKPSRPPSGAALLLGPAVLALCLLAALACRRFRPRAWRATAFLRSFLWWAGLPVVVFHLFYPFHLARFVLLPWVLLLFCGILWTWALLDRAWARLPSWAPAGAMVFLAAACLAARPAETPGENPYVNDFFRAADEILPGDGVLVCMENYLYVDRNLLRGTGRILIPLRFKKVRTVGRYGERRRPLFLFNAYTSPEKIGDLLRSGRRVFLELLRPKWSGHLDAVRRLLDLYGAEVVWRWRGKDALAELRLR